MFHKAPSNHLSYINLFEQLFLHGTKLLNVY